MSGIIDAEPVEETPSLPAVRVELPATLLEGSSPRSQLAHAQEIATALADIIERQGLFVQIGKKKHVVVEGWTMLGSILGVFPITEWTRQTEDGWEARVVARTLAGADVGAAEAQCTRLEKEWGPNPTRGKPRDDYALRSMAQTRAVSKALRMPLGFIMTLAGYEATPEAEMPQITAAGEPEPVFDPGKDILEGAIRGDNYAKRLANALEHIGPDVDWAETIGQAWPGERTAQFWRRLANMVERITQEHPEDFPPVTDEALVDAFAWAFEGKVVTIEYKPAPEPEPEGTPAAPTAPEKSAKAKKDAEPEQPASDGTAALSAEQSAAVKTDDTIGLGDE